MEEKNLTLGQRITAYRTKAHLSQDSLAELLEVSRQSVSKWETDASTPELSKLVRLSQVFGVSLDELVKGEPAAASEQKDIHEASQWDAAVLAEDLRRHRQKISGIALLAVSGFACLLHFELIMLVWPLLILGVLCFVTKRVTGLDVCWFLWLSTVAICYGATSVNLLLIFHPSAYKEMMVQLFLAWLLWLALAVLVGVTAWRLQTGKAEIPEWPAIGVMAAVGIAVMALYWYLFGLAPHRNILSYLFAAVLAFLALAKLWARRRKSKG